MARRGVSFNRGRLGFSWTNKKIDRKTGEIYYKDGSFSFNVLGLVAIILICACLFGILVGSSTRTFEGFLTMLSNMPVIDTSWLIDGVSVVVMPDIPVIAELLDFLWSVCTFIVMIVSGLYNALVFAFAFVFWLVV